MTHSRLLVRVIVALTLGASGTAYAAPPQAFPVTSAEKVAVKYWGITPCGGTVAFAYEALSPTVNAEASWWNPTSVYGNAGENSDCRVAYNDARMDWTWPMLCTITTHEFGHLLGHEHSANPSDVMYQFYTSPLLPACANPRKPPRAAPRPRRRRRASAARRRLVGRRFAARRARVAANGRLGRIVAAANRIARTPYRYGGGHGGFQDTAYDCSGSVSYVLHGGGVLAEPLTSGGFETYGASGRGRLVTVYANAQHVWMTIRGKRYDTISRAMSGTRWSSTLASVAGYTVRHPYGL
jgi:hypothetical protein